MVGYEISAEISIDYEVTECEMHLKRCFVCIGLFVYDETRSRRCIY